VGIYYLSMRGIYCLVMEIGNWEYIVKKSKKLKTPKSRNWIAVHAFQRSGAGKHKSKKVYTRKSKHKGRKL